MSFLEHLGELRGVLVQSLSVFAVLTVALWFFSGQILDFLIRDLSIQQLNFFAPSEAFMVRLRISLALALVGAFPFILFKVWLFVSPALFDRERGKLYPLLVAASALFYVGMAFCYLVLIPIVMDFLLGFATEHVSPLISVSAYFSMVVRLCFTFGLVFQLPILVMVLTMMGIVSPEVLRRKWRYAVIAIFTAAAVLTPPDPASQVLLAVPVLVLYIVSVLLAQLAVRRKKDDD